MKIKCYLCIEHYLENFCGTCPSAAWLSVDDVAAWHQEIQQEVYSKRLNGEKVDMAGLPPRDVDNVKNEDFDGEYSWCSSRVEDGRVYGVQESNGVYYYALSYHFGPRDLEWFAAVDCNYLSRLLREGTLQAREPAVWQLREMDHAQERDIGEWWREKHNQEEVKDFLENFKDYQQLIEFERESQERREASATLAMRR